MKKIMIVLLLVIMLSSCSNTQLSTSPSSFLINQLNSADDIRDTVESLQAITDYNRVKEYTLHYNIETGNIIIKYQLEQDEYTLLQLTVCEIECIDINIDTNYNEDEFYEMFNKYVLKFKE